MRLAGLTGGIASGKSTVSNRLKSLGFAVIDCDVISHNVSKKGGYVFREIVRVFGSVVIGDDGELNRKLLGEVIFSSETERHRLNRIIQPHIAFQIIIEVIHHWISGAKVVILDAPVLFESKIDWLTSPILVVSCTITEQMERLIRRDSLNEEEARSRINSQMPLSKKVEMADYVIDNSSTKEELQHRIEGAVILLNSPYSLREFLFSRNLMIGLLLFLVIFQIVKPLTN